MLGSAGAPCELSTHVRQVTLNIFVMEFGQDTWSFSSKVGKALNSERSNHSNDFSRTFVEISMIGISRFGRARKNQAFLPFLP